MEYYFFLKAPDLDAEIVLANFPPSPDHSSRDQPAHVCIAQPEEKSWNIQTLAQVESGASYAVRSKEFPDWTDDILRASLVFLSYQSLDGKHEKLPVTEDFSSVPAWRASLKIRSPFTTVSYQGEYPGRMMQIPKGSLISFGPFSQKGEGIRNALFVASFSAHPRQVGGRILFRGMQSGRLLGERPIISNQVNYIDLDGILPEDPDEMVLAASPDTPGIPLYFSFTQDARYLSLEHTLSPTEYTAFGLEDVRMPITRLMKTGWMDKITDESSV